MVEALEYFGIEKLAVFTILAGIPNISRRACTVATNRVTCRIILAEAYLITILSVFSMYTRMATVTARPASKTFATV